MYHHYYLFIGLLQNNFKSQVEKIMGHGKMTSDQRDTRNKLCDPKTPTKHKPILGNCSIFHISSKMCHHSNMTTLSKNDIFS